MQVEIDFGDGGIDYVDISPDDLSYVESKDLIGLYDKLNSDEKRSFDLEFMKLNGVSNTDDPKQIIHYVLQDLDTDTAKQILEDLNKDFLSAKEWQKRLKESTNETNNSRKLCS